MLEAIALAVLALIVLVVAVALHGLLKPASPRPAPAARARREESPSPVTMSKRRTAGGVKYDVRVLGMLVRSSSRMRLALAYVRGGAWVRWLAQAERRRDDGA